MKLTGAQAFVFFDSFDPERVLAYSGSPVATQPGKWYFVLEQGAGSNFPYKGSVIRAPSGAAAQQIALVAGDRVFPIDETRVCKTSASLSMEEGTVDVGDDCDPGATILDGIVQYSGSLGRFFRYDDQTMDFDDVTSSMLHRFLNSVQDDGAGAYEVKERHNGPAYLLINLNSNAKAGQIEHWIFVPAILSSLSLNLGNAEAQGNEIPFAKGEGDAVHYAVPKAA